MYRNLLYCAFLLWGISLVAAALSPGLPAEPTGDAPRRPVTANADKAAPRPLIGYAINLHNVRDIQPHLDAIDELADMGIDSLQVLTPVFQTNGASTRIVFDPDQAPANQDIIRVLRRAKERGMTTALMPTVLFHRPRGNEWRGKIAPDEWDAWWKSYRQVINVFVDVANEAQADMLCVGSELVSTEAQTDRWVALIAHVRQRYAGRLYYSTVWNSYHKPQFWSHLDMIGICAYFDLTVGADSAIPDAPFLARRWRDIRELLLAYARQQQRPILFTEVGYPSLPWALREPYNYILKPGVAARHDVQAMGLGSFLAAWGDLLRPKQPAAEKESPLAGAFFYSWEPRGTGDARDYGYGIKGKPALSVLRKWLKPPNVKPDVSPVSLIGASTNPRDGAGE
ncbi:MAG: hypothetical protein WEC36_15195 [Phycisphaeraceae bacterium]